MDTKHKVLKDASTGMANAAFGEVQTLLFYIFGNYVFVNMVHAKIYTCIHLPMPINISHEKDLNLFVVNHLTHWS